MSQYSEPLIGLGQRLEAAEEYLGLEVTRKEYEELEKALAEPDLWSNPEEAKTKTKRFGQLGADIALLVGIRGDLEEALVANELLDEGADEFEIEVTAKIEAVERALSLLEIRSLLSGEFDEGDAICEIHAGVGGTDAQDWAQMMLRMYQRFCESKGFEFELDEVTSGGEAGILSATFIVKGRYAYGLFNAEKGVHRLVRISPFDSQHRRQTSFSSLDVTPLLDDEDLPPVDEKDLRIDTYRSSGAGGQHVNVTDSAVRITHLPTGIVVSCQNERSQLQNKNRAMQILAAKLAEKAREDRKASLDALGGPQVDVGWGNQIRSYTLAPYQLIKDHRSGHEDGNVQAVIDGEIEPFMEATMRWRRAQRN